MRIFKTTFWVMVLLFCQEVSGQKILSNWATAKQSDDIKIAYRLLEVGDTLKTRQMGIWFTTQASSEEILTMFTDENQLSKWSAGIKECSILEQSEPRWLTYTVYDIPWPFEQKDLVTEYNMVQEGEKTVLYLKSRPNGAPVYPDIVRLRNYEGKWIFTPAENGTTKISFYSISFSKRVLPKFIQDPVIQNVFIDSIQRLKVLLGQQ